MKAKMGLRRRRRVLTVLRCIRCCTCFICLFFFLFFSHLTQTIINYRSFQLSFPFSTVPFWKDDRILNRIPLLPLVQPDQINISQSSIVVAACCRNVHRHLPGFQQNIQSITELFGQYRIYLGESDSTDSTLTYLQQWQSKDPQHVRVLSHGQQRWTMFSRTARIASCRNSLLSAARAELSSFDYYFVVDVDVGSSSEFDVDDFLSNFLYPSSSWLAMTATQRSEYYDIWALRIPPILPFDCWKKIDELTSIFFDQTSLVDRLVKIHQAPIPRETALIEVQSAFGGAALYNGKYLNKDCLYDGIGHYWGLFPYSKCEHVTFHQCLQQHLTEQKIFINPTFQIC